MQILTLIKQKSSIHNSKTIKMKLLLLIPFVGFILIVRYNNLYQPDNSTWCYVYRNAAWLLPMNAVSMIICGVIVLEYLF